jgi:hypothetical protein
MTNTLPPPTRANQSHTAVRVNTHWANASVWQPGDGFTVTEARDFIALTATKPRDGHLDDEVSIHIHRDGIPALIAELQRLMAR